MNILERIQLLCNEIGITPSKLEVELGLGKGTLYKWNKNYPNSQKLMIVADYFNVSTDWLLGKSDIRNYPKVHTIAAHFDGDEYTDEEIMEIKRFAEFVKSRKKDD